MTKMLSKTDIQKNEPQDYNPLNMVAEVGMMMEPTPRRGINKELQAVPIGEPVGGTEPSLQRRADGGRGPTLWSRCETACML